MIDVEGFQESNRSYCFLFGLLGFSFSTFGASYSYLISVGTGDEG